MFEIIEFCVKLSLLAVLLSLWFTVLLVTMVGYTIHHAVTKGEGGQGWIDGMRDFNRVCDSLMRAL